MAAKYTVTFLLFTLLWVTGVDCALEVKPRALLVSAQGSLKQESPDSDPQSVSSGPISEALLSCVEVLPDGNTHRPSERVIWTQNRHTISTAGAKYRNFGLKKKLLIRDLIPEDSGIYECAMISNTTEKGRAELWVAPQVLSAPPHQSLMAGAVAGVVTCLVTDGVRTVNWTKGGHFIGHSNGTHTSVVDSRYTVQSSGSLHIANITEEDAGVYNCTVSNPAGGASRAIEVEVDDDQFPFTKSESCIMQYESGTEYVNTSSDPYNTTSAQNTGTPIFTHMPPACIRTVEGFDVVLRCSAEGDPKPVLTWIRDMKDAITGSEGDRYTLLPDGSLKISAVQGSDGGDYSCQASNEHQTRSVMVQLKVAMSDQICGRLWDEDLDTTSVGGTEHRAKRIVEGEASHIKNWPWQVLIEYNEAVTHTHQSVETLCGGALIRPDWLVTAAHCLYLNSGWVPPRHLILRVGVFNRSDKTEKYQQKLVVDRIVIHPDYPVGAAIPHSDIALIKLKHPVKLTSHVGLICLPSPHLSTPPAGTLCSVTGWGHKVFGSGGSPERLHSAEVPLVSRSQCTSGGQSYKKSAVSLNELCAGWTEGGADACQNDSGGPLACRDPDEDGDRWILNGVINRGIGCGNPHKYGIYANVAHHVDWINSVIP